MKTFFKRLFSKLEKMNLAMCSYRDAWQIQAVRAAEIQNMNAHEARRPKRSNETDALYLEARFRA